MLASQEQCSWNIYLVAQKINGKPQTIHLLVEKIVTLIFRTITSDRLLNQQARRNLKMGLDEEAEREDVVFVKMNLRARIAYDNHNFDRRSTAQCRYKSGELTFRS